MTTADSTQKLIGIFVFDDVEVLDFAGPFETFSVTGSPGPHPFRAILISEHEEAKVVTARHGFTVIANYSFETHPPLWGLLVPGGLGTRKLLDNVRISDWIKSQHQQSTITMSVCTGALLLASAGILQNLSATTHHRAVEELESIDATIRVQTAVKWVDNGKVITSAGISAGIDMSYHVIARFLGMEAAIKTAAYMEYAVDVDRLL